MSKILHLNVQSYRISQSTVSPIWKSAHFLLRKKRKVHKLTLSTTEKRHKHALRLYRQLANYRYRNFVTTNESSFYLDGTEGKRNVCYIKKTDPDYEKMILQQGSSRPKSFMIWAGILSNGKTSMHFVQPGAKTNANYYIDHILKPFLSGDLRRLFPVGEEKKMI